MLDFFLFIVAAIFQIKMCKTTYMYWSRIMLFFIYYAHSASRLFQLTFWFPLLARFYYKSRKAQLDRKQFANRKVSAFNNNPSFPVWQFQFNTQLFVGRGPIGFVKKMDWRGSYNHEVSGFEFFLSCLHNQPHEVQFALMGSLAEDL